MSAAVFESGGPHETQTDPGTIESLGEATDDDSSPGTLMVTASAVVVGLGKKLRLFSCAQVYAVAVRVVRIALFFAGLAGLEVTVTRNDVINTVAAAVTFVAAVLWEVMLCGLSNVAFRKCDRAANDSELHRNADSLAANIESLCLVLCAIFNTISVSMVTKTAMDLVLSSVLYIEVIAVVAVSILIMAIFWIGGFVGMQLWYGRSKFIKTKHFLNVVNEPIDDLQQIPFVVRVWIRMIFGRLRPQKGKVKASRDKIRYVFLLQHFEKLNFTPEQIHIMKILHEAMSFAALWLLVRMYTVTLVLVTYCFGNLWSQVISELVELAKSAVLFVLVAQACSIFQETIWADRADIYNLVAVFDALRKLFARLSIMYFVTTTLQGILPVLPYFLGKKSL